jgi:transposase, IS30 family
MGRPPYPAEVVRGFWAGVRWGMLVDDAGAAVGVSRAAAWRFFAACGGVMPPVRERVQGSRLSLAEREEIACLVAAEAGIRAIARELGRDPSTISNELKRNRSGDGRYRASVAQQKADERARSSGRPARLSTNLRLRGEVQARLKQKHSPEQIARRLREDFPEDPEMWVSHETIYQSIYIQGRGALKRELAQHLRTGRTVRQPRRQAATRRARQPERIKDMINISERPPEVEDRAVPGHWEGDLITGTENRSAIGTLVERTSGFLVLLHLPVNHGALAVQDAVSRAVADLPATLRKTLTWDQGIEMANHAKIAAATGLEIYFCDPHSPWQRGTNENTNGLLRQYFPKGTDLSFHGAGILEQVAIEVNNRPRKRLNWRTPAEALDKLLSEHNDTGVANAG